ncbi:hypothetical protein ABIE12_002636 [Serratia sp. 509]
MTILLRKYILVVTSILQNQIVFSLITLVRMMYIIKLF